MSACYEDAFKLASNHDQLQLYGDLLVDEMIDGEVQNQFIILATHFESKNNSLLAGKYYYHGKQYRKVRIKIIDRNTSIQDYKLLHLRSA